MSCAGGKVPPQRRLGAGFYQTFSAWMKRLSLAVPLVTELHNERLDVVCNVLVDTSAKSVLDLGCGSGALLERLVHVPQFETLVGVDKCGASLWRARRSLGEHLECQPPRVALLAGSYTDRDARLRSFEACAMVETIEHVDPARLTNVERSVFGFYRPTRLVMTTPNADFNVRFGLGRGQFRHADHRFEWSREKFRRWATGVANRNGYEVRFSGIGELEPLLGQPTQMALFTRIASRVSREAAVPGGARAARRQAAQRHPGG
jgi:small RNA 2'-O-methyltransferase